VPDAGGVTDGQSGRQPHYTEDESGRRPPPGDPPSLAAQFQDITTGTRPVIVRNGHPPNLFHPSRSEYAGSQGRADGHGGGRSAYAIRLIADGSLGAAGTLVGTSALSEADLRNESIHLASTLYGSRWWGTQVNADSKLLLLAHCFEDCGYGRVKIQTDVLNTRSQAAIAKLGAQREGVLRRHIKREDGTFRDSVVYSVLKDEWPAVRARLTSRLQ
jgi:RimJ/RimL family protein N-acetyltransferase